MVVIILLVAARPCAAEDRLAVRLPSPPDSEARSCFQYRMAGGATVNDALEVRNESDRPLTVRAYPCDAFNTPDGGLNGVTASDPLLRAGAWLTLEAATLQLRPRSWTRLPFSMRVPECTTAGAPFALIVLEPVVEDAPTVPIAGKNGAVFRVRVAERLAVAVWTRVPGELASDLRVEGLQREVRDGVLALCADVRNPGNTFLKPFASWTLRTAAGERVAGQERSPWGYLLPGGRLRLRAPLATRRPLPRGQYIFEVTVEYESSRVVERKTLQLT